MLGSRQPRKVECLAAPMQRVNKESGPLLRRWSKVFRSSQNKSEVPATKTPPSWQLFCESLRQKYSPWPNLYRRSRKAASLLTRSCVQGYLPTAETHKCESLGGYSLEPAIDCCRHSPSSPTTCGVLPDFSLEFVLCVIALSILRGGSYPPTPRLISAHAPHAPRRADGCGCGACFESLPSLGKGSKTCRLRLEQQRSIAKAQELEARPHAPQEKAGATLDAGWNDHRCRPSPQFRKSISGYSSVHASRLSSSTVPKGSWRPWHLQLSCKKGADVSGKNACCQVMTLDGPDKPKGMLDMRDISRKAGLSSECGGEHQSHFAAPARNLRTSGLTRCSQLARR